ALEDGTVFQGVSIGIFGQAVGEVVFNTALTGYQEIVSDPSYCQQIITLTYPHIGNVGTNSQDEESARVYAAGLVIRDLALQYSNPRGQRSLQQYLNEHQVVGIAGIDTRALTRLLREKGAQRGCLMTGPGVSMSGAVEAARNYPGLVGADLARDVSTKTPYRWSQGSAPLLVSHTQPIATTYRVMAFDFGIKRTILRLLVDRGCQVTVVPAQTTAAEALSSKPEGVFLSNGPGDPEPCDYAIKAIREIVQQGLPVFGICLGHQLLGLACGAKTVKMKFGHHGANHPVLDLDTGRVLITSQNHGFAVDPESLPDSLRITHRSLFDGSLQGIHHKEKPAFGFQGHPEASPGPQDMQGLFDHFVDLMAERKPVQCPNGRT
ncbi:MAG: glutamine-hydrolyzing carbamoyl-phosphate synthase small subunit, partial [Gammaproteobacteria bacterium]